MTPMMVKHCISRGCPMDPMYGFGSALKGTIRWACGKHRALIRPAETPVRAVAAAPAAEGQGAFTRRSATNSQAQGSLL